MYYREYKVNTKGDSLCILVLHSVELPFGLKLDEHSFSRGILKLVEFLISRKSIYVTDYVNYLKIRQKKHSF